MLLDLIIWFYLILFNYIRREMWKYVKDNEIGIYLFVSNKWTSELFKEISENEKT